MRYCSVCSLFMDYIILGNETWVEVKAKLERWSEVSYVGLGQVGLKMSTWNAIFFCKRRSEDVVTSYGKELVVSECFKYLRWMFGNTLEIRIRNADIRSWSCRYWGKMTGSWLHWFGHVRHHREMHRKGRWRVGIIRISIDAAWG